MWYDLEGRKFDYWKSSEIRECVGNSCEGRKKKIIERHKFSGIDRLDSYIGSWKGFPWYCVIFSKDTECTNHITNWFDFRCCLGFGENNRSAVQNPNIVAIATTFAF